MVNSNNQESKTRVSIQQKKETGRNVLPSRKPKLAIVSNKEGGNRSFVYVVYVVVVVVSMRQSDPEQ